MEPITMAATEKILWDFLVEPLVNAAKKEYGKKTIDVLKKRFQQLPFKENEKEVLEVEIIDALEKETITDEKSLIDFLNKNSVFLQALNNLQKEKIDIEDINSFKKVANSEITVNGENKKISDSFDNINDSKINI